jgi:hypothetical protein
MEENIKRVLAAALQASSDAGNRVRSGWRAARRDAAHHAARMPRPPPHTPSPSAPHKPDARELAYAASLIDARGAWSPAGAADGAEGPGDAPAASAGEGLLARPGLPAALAAQMGAAVAGDLARLDPRDLATMRLQVGCVFSKSFF